MGVERCEGVQERTEQVYLIGQGVLGNDEVLREPTVTLGIGGVVIGVDIVLVGQCGLVVEHPVVGRRADSAQLLGKRVVTVLLGPGEGVLVEDPIGLTLADHLPGPDECGIAIGCLRDGEDPEGGSPGLPEQKNLVLVETVAQVVADLDGVVDLPLEGEGVGGVEFGIGAARPALVPGGHRERLLELPEVVAHRTSFGATGPTG